MKRGLDLNAFQTVVEMLASTGTLPPKYKPHRLKGKYYGLWECHISPDWLLVWEQHDEELLLVLVDTGTHSDIFK
jgi:mRNA interferase YafQ